MQEYNVHVHEDRTVWYQNDLIHRLDGPARVYKNGTKEYWKCGEFHRTDGPAVERSDGARFWYQNGKCHRTDGPAVVYADGRVEYWENGKQIPNPNNVKEMTVAEIAKKLGYEIKIVK